MQVLRLRVGLPETSDNLKFWTCYVTMAFRLNIGVDGLFTSCVWDGVTGLVATVAIGRLSRYLG